MANSSIIHHMMYVLDRYQAKTIRASEVEVFLDQYAQALEGLSPILLHLVRLRTAQLVRSELADGNTPPLEEISSAAALEQLRALVRSLDGESSPDIVLGTMPARI